MKKFLMKILLLTSILGVGEQKAFANSGDLEKSFNNRKESQIEESVKSTQENRETIQKYYLGDAQDIKTGKYYTYRLQEWNDKSVKFTLNSDGYIAIKHNVVKDSKGRTLPINISVYDKNKNEIQYINLDENSKKKNQYEYKIGLPKGTYYVKFNILAKIDKSQNVKYGIAFKSSKSYETEKNDDKKSADRLNFNKKTYGFLSNVLDDDIYVISAKKDMKAIIYIKRDYKGTPSSYDEVYNYTFTDAKGKKVSKYEDRMSSNGKGYYTMVVDLKKGNNYFELKTTAENISYTLEIKDKCSLKEQGNVNVLDINCNSTKIKGYADRGSIIKVYANGKQIGKTTKVDKYGNFIINIPKQKSGTRVTGRSYKKGYYYFDREIKVLNVFKTFKINSISNKTTVVKGVGTSNAHIRISSGYKTIGSGTVNSKGEFIVKIPKQKSGTKLKVEMYKGGYEQIEKEIKVK